MARATCSPCVAALPFVSSTTSTTTAACPTGSPSRTTAAAADTWAGAEPWFHVSSPAQGWHGRDPRPHHDRLWLRDLPPAWRTMRATIDVEAKGKEAAVLPLLRAVSAH